MLSQGLYYLIRALVTLVAIPVHEAGHALASWLLGDPTAKNNGRLSLNPLRHFDLWGTLCMIFVGVGWAKPVSTDPRRFRSPKAGMALTALAGPLANILLAYLAMVGWKLLYYWAPYNDVTFFAALFLQYLIYMDVGLAVFNLIPVPPLDGSRVLLTFLPRNLYFGLMKYEQAILVILLAAVWCGILNTPLAVLNDVVWELLDLGTGFIDKIAYSAYYASLGVAA
ncbi:MAG: site-2 protease family protein [Faecalibacterium sp.]